MAGNNDPSERRLRANPVIYKSSALAATAPNLANKQYDSACIAAAAETAEDVRRRFKEGQVDAKGNVIPVVSGDGEAADAQRHKRRVALNRNSAASSRVRKEAYVSALEAQLANLERHYNTLCSSLGTGNGAAQLARSDHDASASAGLAQPSAIAALTAETVSAEVASAAAAPVPPPPPAPRQPQLVSVPDPPSESEGSAEVAKAEKGVAAVALNDEKGTADSAAQSDFLSEPAPALAVEVGPLELIPELAAMDPGLADEVSRISGIDNPYLLDEPEMEPLADLLKAYNALGEFADQLDGKSP